MTKADKALITTIIIISLLGMIGIFYFHSSDIEEKYVIIEVENQLVEKIVMDNTTKSNYSFSFQKGIGVMEIENGAVRMREMNKEICPKGICSDMGWISKSYESIVCLPNNIVITIEGKQDTEIDIVS